MQESEWLAEGFEENRTHLKVVAYRILIRHAPAHEAGFGTVASGPRGGRGEQGG